ncbi:YtxH domain-containing protein [Sphingobacteriaceae bacterium WQ 2009]|uniref:YtxH domain-containing protein n=1 Tax=Rhinopithecimicrobium faecis TaxID=2820698 RepID=A0A8T4HA55_9SPHI|nr:YtxH domain-containing protein [Sphingobacteriaceae bacterium WQ 2009]
MENKNGVIAFALIGLAAGVATYYLLGTDDGKKQLERANEGIKDITNSLKGLAQKEGKRASKFAKRAVEEIDDIKEKAKEQGKDVLDKVNDSAQHLANKVDEKVDTAKSKVSNA